MKHIANIIFRIALMQLNNYIKTNFAIFDEILDFADDASTKHTYKIIDQLKEYYDFAIIISHKSDLKAKFDHTIKIINDGKYSKLSL